MISGSLLICSSTRLQQFWFAFQFAFCSCSCCSRTGASKLSLNPTTLATETFILLTVLLGALAKLKSCLLRKGAGVRTPCGSSGLTEDSLYPQRIRCLSERTFLANYHMLYLCFLNTCPPYSAICIVAAVRIPLYRIFYIINKTKWFSQLFDLGYHERFFFISIFQRPM